MQNKMYNILVPVNFTVKNTWAIDKAIELANNFNCNIHLVHVVFKPVFPFVHIDNSNFTPYASHIEMQSSREKLAELKAIYKQQLRGGAQIEISLLQGYPKKELKKYIEAYQMDMVVTGLPKFHLPGRIMLSISVRLLAKSINIPVLAVRCGGKISHLKKNILQLHEDISAAPVQYIQPG